jgi:hypothetical protein
VNAGIMSRKRRREEDNNSILTAATVSLPTQMVNSFCQHLCSIYLRVIFYFEGF